MAIECAKKLASHIIILDINEQGGLSVCEEIKHHGAKADFFQVDLSSLESIKNGISNVNSIVDKIDILINNAGIVVGKKFQDHSDEEITKTISVNLNACMILTKMLLPGMLQNGKGHIVNIASSAGMAAFPTLSVYAASKWGMIGWSESLRLELEASSSGVKVTTVTPYLIDTGMFDGVKSPIIPLLKPLRVAKDIVRSIEKNKIFSRMPWLVYTIPFFKGILPQRTFDYVVGKLFGVYKTMDTFKGRQ